MSDGIYTFNSSKEGESFSGVMEVSRGKFRGENNIYRYSGHFSIEIRMLNGIVSLENKETGIIDEVAFSSTILNDEEFNININIDNQKVDLVFKKAQEETKNHDMLLGD